MIESLSNIITKQIYENNPCLPTFFNADPTAVEYDGRLYVYGSNDQEMYENLKADEEVNYGYIKSLAIMSTDDMANWTYHGNLDITKACSWAGNSWAPSVCSRVEEDGLTHFYMYFANGGNGIGVVTSTSPVGPWKDPLGHALVSRSTKGLGVCEWLFDPGVVIDEKGDAYLSFGGGPKSDGSKIVKLGNDMISFDSEIVSLKTPKHFEASELNYMNGYYVLSYCTTWDKDPVASMCYMTTKTPLDADSWEYKGEFFKNTGSFGLGYGNNHTHLHKYEGKYYLVYQAHKIHTVLGIKGDCRNLYIDEAQVDEEKALISDVRGTSQGVAQIKNADVFKETPFACLSTGSGFKYVRENSLCTGVKASVEGTVGAWTVVKNADFGSGAEKILVKAKGKGLLKVYLDANRIAEEPLCSISFDGNDGSLYEGTFSEKVSGVHNLYFVFNAGDGLELGTWKIQ